jgi:type VII secretion integral membrane protein EccD
VVSLGEAGLSRITLVAPRARVDLALPADVPLADLLPTLLGYASDSRSGEPVVPEAWALSRLGGVALDSSRTPAQLGVHDGELLYLRPRGGGPPMLVFDDVVDAVATATNERADRWRPATTRLFGLGLAVVALLGGAVLLLLTGPPQFASGLIGFGLAVVLLVVAVLLARASGDSRAGVAFAVMAMVYAAVGGLLTLAGDLPVAELAGPHILMAVTALFVVAVIAAVGVADAASLFLGTALTALALAIVAGICLIFDAQVPAAAAIVATIAFGALPALPMLAYRLGGLPIPTVPMEPGDLKRDAEVVDGAMVLERSHRADGFLTGMLGCLSVIGAGAAVVTSYAGWPGIMFAGLLGLLLMARARHFLSRTQRLWLLCAGAVALATCTVAIFGVVSQVQRLTILLAGIAALAAISAGYGLAKPGKARSPLWGRALDVLEVILILGLVPLAIWVSGLYSWIRAIRG